MLRNELLQNWGLDRDPFAEYDAYDEGGNLESFFLEPPYFREMLGNPGSPRSCILYGARGDGKSAVCTMIRYHLQNQFPKKALIVNYERFPPLDGTGQAISLERHLDCIISLVVEEFIKQIDEHIELLQALEPKDLLLLKYFALRYLPAVDLREVQQRLYAVFDRLQKKRKVQKLTKKGFLRLGGYMQRKRVQIEKAGSDGTFIGGLLRSIILALTDPIPGSETLRNQEPLRVFERLVEVVVAAGFQSVYLLVDRVDEREPYSNDDRLASELIAPLVTSLSFLQCPSVASKFFLPLQLKEFLGSRVRTDKIRTRQIEWSDDRLAAMLEARLKAFSGGKVATLKAFVDEVTWEPFNQDVYFYAAFNPRNLIRILDTIISELCELEDHPKVIGQKALDSGMRHFTTIRMAEYDAKDYQQRLRRKDQDRFQQRK